jgi:hypothetical protein
MEENKPDAGSAPDKDYAPNQIRDRVKELRHVRARDLVPHPNNWKNTRPFRGQHCTDCSSTWGSSTR